MNVAYVAITVLAAITYAFAAYLSFIRHESVVAVAERVQVPLVHPDLTPLAALAVADE